MDLREPHLILGVGELLWDMLPEGPRLGGAPANFTVMAGRLGDHAAILSRVGRDELGRSAMELLYPLPVDSGHVQIDARHDTGRVTVELKSGQPSFTIHEPAAWDFLELSDEWLQLAERASAICFGSLAQRSSISRQTVQTLVAETPETCVRVFDVNLRAPFYSAEIVQESLGLATVMKMNDAEVPLVLSLLDLDRNQNTDRKLDTGGAKDLLRLGAQRLLREFPGLKMAAVTRGGNGSLLVTREGCDEHSGVAVKIADTIGAGDAFTAAMTHYLLRGASLATLNEAGNRWGGWMASQSGAMPELPDETRAEIASAIER
ncbi:MAG: PfkB family carbohydrate kinase [Terracidiphilus sp.]